MPSGFLIAKAWIEVEPDTTGLDAKLKAAIARDNVTAKVKVDPDTTGLGAKLKAQTDAAAASAGSSGGGIFSNKFVGGTTFGKSGAIVTGVGSALSMLPGLAGVAGIGMGTMLSAKLITTLAGKNTQLQTAFKDVFGGGTGKNKVTGDLTTVLENAFKPMVPAITGVLHQVMSLAREIAPQLTGIFKIIAPQLHGIFANVAVVIKDVVGLMHAAAPAFGPFINAILHLAQGVLPGLITVVHATVPVFGMFGRTLATLGQQVGHLFTAMAPAVHASMTVIQALMHALGGLLPIIGGLAATFAKALAPVLVAVAHAFKALEPAITVIGGILAKLAGAVLSSIVGVLQAAGKVIEAVAPAVGRLAGAFGQVFNVLENSGVLFTIENALEKLAGPLGRFISQLIDGLAPILPPIISAISRLLGLIAGVLSTALQAALPPLTTLVTLLAQLLSKAITPLLPYIQQLAQMLASFLSKALTALMPSLGQLAAALVKVLIAVTPLLPPLMAIINLAVKLALTALTPLIGLLTVVIGWLAKLVAGIGVVIGWVAQFIAKLLNLNQTWQTIWQFIQTIWNNIYNFLSAILTKIINWFRQQWNQAWNDLKTIWNNIYSWFQGWWNNTYSFVNGVVTKVLGFLRNSWNTAWSDVKNIWGNIESSIQGIWSSVANWVTSNIDTFLGDVRAKWAQLKADAAKAWNDLENIFKAPVNFLIQTVYMGGIRRLWDDVVNAVGLSSLDLPSVSPLASGGRITQGTGPTADDVLVRVSRGETVVSAAHSAMLAPLFAAVGVPGYSLGGLIGDIFGAGGDMGKMMLAIATDNQVAFSNAFADMLGVHKGPGQGGLGQIMAELPVKLTADVIKAAWSALVGSDAGSGKGPGGGDPRRNESIARSMFPWPAAMWPSYVALEMAEAGFNRFARNPSSGAYGIPQALPPTKMPFAAQAAGGSHAGPQISWMYDYIRSTYHDPVQAERHERQFHWYGNGLDGGIFTRPTLIGVGDGGPERVDVTPLSNGRTAPVVNVTFTGMQYPTSEQIGSLKFEIGQAILAGAP